MIDYPSAFRWFARPPQERDKAAVPEIPQLLQKTWAQVREELGPAQFDPVLGEIRTGRFGLGDGTAWAQTNDEKDSGYVNLTLELEASELSLNLIGWYDPQLEKVEGWLRKPKAWRFLRERPDWQILFFVRRARGGSVFQGAPGTEVERLSFTEASPVEVTTRLSTLRFKLDPKTEKLSLHLRRKWEPTEVGTIAEISKPIAEEVGRWLEPINDVRLS